MDSSDTSSAFLKQLASSDRRIRDGAVETLRAYLGHRQSLDEMELLKLWKGLFYCMWMSDKPRTQQQLARDLAGLVDTLQPATVLGFLSAFWKTMSREWVDIDILRMDKFLYLVRCYLQASFQHFAKKGWSDSKGLDDYINVLAETPLNPTDPKVPNGLRMHVVDVYVDELDKVDSKREGKLPLDKLLAPVKALSEESPMKSIRKHVREALGDERLQNWNGDEKQANGAENGEGDNGDEWGGIND